jgi:type VI secretion system protein ImpH
MGPLTFATYEAFLPGHENLRRIAALVRTYVGYELAWDVRLILRRDQVPALRLDGRGQLGWTTWLVSSPPAHHPEDLILNARGTTP